MDKTTTFVHRDTAHKARHFIYVDGVWYGYASRWKSRFRGPIYAAAYARGPSLSGIAEAIRNLKEPTRMNRVTNLNEIALQRAQEKLRDLIAVAEDGEARLRGTDIGGRLAKTIAEAKKLLPEFKEQPPC